MDYICRNYSYVWNKCKYFIVDGMLINKKDLIKNCDGLKNESDCCWYRAGGFRR